MVNGVLYITHTGCQWRFLPAEFGGVTSHARGGPYGRTNGAKRVVAVDVTGLPLAALVVPASCTESTATELLLLEPLEGNGQADRLELVLVGRGTSAKAARRLQGRFGVEVRRVGWETKSSTFRPIGFAGRVEVAHGRLGRSRRLAMSFENTTRSATGWLQVACLRGVLAAC